MSDPGQTSLRELLAGYDKVVEATLGEALGSETGSRACSASIGPVMRSLSTTQW